MRRGKEDAYQAWLWGEVLLLGLLGAALALFVTYPSLRDTFSRCGGRRNCGRKV